MAFYNYPILILGERDIKNTYIENELVCNGNIINKVQ